MVNSVVKRLGSFYAITILAIMVFGSLLAPAQTIQKQPVQPSLLGIKINQNIANATYILGSPTDISEFSEELIQFDFKKQNYNVVIITNLKSKIKSITVWGLKNSKVKLGKTSLGDSFGKVVRDLNNPIDYYEFNSIDFEITYKNQKFVFSKINNVLVVSGITLFDPPTETE